MNDSAKTGPRRTPTTRGRILLTMSTRPARSDRGAHPSRKLTNAFGTIFALVVTIVGIAAFIVTAAWRAKLGDEMPSWLGVSLEQIAGILIATGILSLFWDLLGRRALADEVMDTAGLAEEIRAAGLTHVWNRYLSEDTWRKRFSQAKKLDVFVAYANTWRETYRHDISEFAQRSGNQVIIVLPDVSDPDTITSIACRSNKTTEEVVRKIEEATEKYKAILAKGKNCFILAHKGPQAYAAYRFDSECIVTLYRNRPKKTGHIPTLAVAGGSFGEFLHDDLDETISQARVIWTSGTLT